MSEIYISIGNSDDKLSQAQWAEFYRRTDEAVKMCSQQVHGRWVSEAAAPFQNACWCFTLRPQRDWKPELRQRLARLAAEFQQDSIAWVQGKTEYLEATQ